MQDIFYVISQKKEEMTNSHKRVATYFQNHVNDLAFDTLEDMATKIGVSTTTMIRFARVLGYEGFSDMQHAVQAGLQEHLRLPNRLNNTLGKVNREKLLTDSFQNDINNINATMQELDPIMLEKAVDLICGAKTVHLLGMRASFALSHYLYSRLSQIKNNVSLIQSIGSMYGEEILKMNPEDVCVAYLFPRYTETTVVMLRALRKKKVPVILITSPDNLTVRDFADVLLTCHITGVSYKNTSAAPICLTNYLAAAVAARDYEGTMATLTELETVLEEGAYMTF